MSKMSYNIKAPGFSGYICGYEGSETFLQLPVFIPINNNLSIEDITKIEFWGDEIVFPCSNYQLSSFTESQYEGYKFATLSFKVLLEESGIFDISKLNISFSENSITELNLGEITLDIRGNKTPQPEYLSMRQFFINQAEPSILRISYANNTNNNITIEDFTYPSNFCTGTSIEKYSDFDLSVKEENLIIPPKEEKTFLITFDFKNEFIENEGQFFYFLPFVVYRINDTQLIMPSQTQATVVQAPFNETTIKKFVN